MAVTIERRAPICPGDSSYKKILGLDISTKTGAAILTAAASGVEVAALKKITFPPSAGQDLKRFERWHKFGDALDGFLGEHLPDIAYIEGYGFSQKNSAMVSIEIGTTLRWVLERHKVPWIEVPPTTLKKFVTGAGNCDKNVMLKEAYKRFGLDVADDDLCDAACLGYFGAAALDYPVPVPESHRKEAKKYGLQLIAKTP